MDSKGFFRKILELFVFPGIPLLILMGAFSFMVSLAYMKDTDPESYNDYIKNTLGLSGGVWHSLPAEAEEQVIALGFEPAVVADEILANRWINENGGEIDLGIQLAILEGESQGGTNLGSCSGVASAAKYSHYEVVAAKWLLNYWKEHNVRSWSELASKMIRPDYSDYTGHCSAGEVGPNGILPTTGVKICRDGLAGHSDAWVTSCNFFDRRVAPYGKNWWLKTIGYRSGQTNDAKFKALYGWNHLSEYRISLLTRAAVFNKAVSEWGEVNPVSENVYTFQGGWWRKQLINLFTSTGLLEGTVYADNQEFPSWDQPVVVGDFTDPYPGSFVCGYTYGTAFANGVHNGVDLCQGSPWGSAPVHAAHGGYVTFSRFLPASENLARQWWISGNVIVIEGKDAEGNTIQTFYGHGANGSVKVHVGDRVEAGQMIMMSGSTGFSSGIHLHFSMQINGGWVNPTAYLGGD